MAGVREFIQNRVEIMPSVPRQDRKDIGEKIKFSIKKPKPNQRSGGQAFSSTAPNPGYGSNSTAARNTFPQQQYSQPSQRGIFDEPVPSEFDYTGSEISKHDEFQGGQIQHKGTNNMGAPDGDYRGDDMEEYDPESDDENFGNNQEHDLPGLPHRQDKHIQQPGRPPSIMNGAAQHYYPILQLNPYSKKHPRGYDEDRTHEGQNQHYSNDQNELPGRREDCIENSQNGANKLDNISTSVARSSALDDQQQGSDPDTDDYDYNDEQLNAMDYRELKSQTWEAEEDAIVRDTPGESTAPLETRFQEILQLNDKEGKLQLDFFSTLSILEWEEAGELFMARFAGLMTKMKEQRRARRVMVSKYEKRIEIYEGLVRGKSENLDEKLQDMKKGGEGVLRGKCP